MPQASALPFESTTVRTTKPTIRQTPATLRYLRRAFTWLGPRAPHVAAALAERVFRTPPPYKADAGEADALFFGDPLTIPFGAEELRGWSFGEGPAVLLVHGWGGRATQLRAFIEPLVSTGHRVVLFDGPGHGASGRGSSSLPEFGAAVGAALRAIGPVHAVIAHSMGGPATVLGLEQVESNPRLVFLAPPADVRDVTARFGRALHIPEHVVHLMERRIESRFLRPIASYDLPKLGASARSPLLVVHDTKDREVPFSDGERVARGWNAELVATSGLGHVRLLRDAGVVERAVSFVAARPMRADIELWA
jgi:pimeloyl-ACP methyl ester carboxylesterase